MFMHITVINLFDQNVYMACAKVRLRCTCITCIDLVVGMVCAKVRLGCSFISLLLIYLITMWIWHVPKLDSDAHLYY